MRRWRHSRPTAAAPLRFWPQPERGVRRWLGSVRSLILAAILLMIWPTLDPALIEPPTFLSTEPERVDLHFTRCGEARSHACVVDGDTFRIGKRRIRIVGIDAPEIAGQCASERTLAAASTVKLQSLLNDGPFVMTGRIDDMTDRYGRELRVLTRKGPGGGTQSIAEDMRDSGLARRYAGRKANWC